MKALIAFASLALLVASPAHADETAPWRAVDAETGQVRDVSGLEALAEDFPESGSLRLRLLQPLLAAGETDKLLEVLRWLKDRGYVFSDVSQEQIPALIGEEHAEAARALLLPQAEVIEASEVVAIVPAEAGVVESVFAPTWQETYIVTSVTNNALLIKVLDDDWVTAPIPGANDLSGLVSTDDGSIGWVASANLDGSEDSEDLFTGLFGLTGDFDNPERIAAPDGIAVSDLVLAPGGWVYASDPLGGGVYRAVPGETRMEVLVAPGTFRSPQGLAVSKDGARLYVSDYRYGLAIIDLANGAVSRLPSDVPAIADGIDGMWLHNGELIAVQNGTSPMRISAFALSEDGSRIIGHRVLEQAHSEWTEPLGGNISGDALVYIGTGQWDRFVKGEPAQDMPAIPTQIRRLPLGVQPD